MLVGTLVDGQNRMKEELGHGRKRYRGLGSGGITSKDDSASEIPGILYATTGILSARPDPESYRLYLLTRCTARYLLD